MAETTAATGGGDTGQQGRATRQGSRGSAGAAGAAGDKGPAGSKGATGSAGPTGDKGPTGKQGPTGPAGDKGAAGPTGPAGDKGAAGPAGPPGVQGAAGEASPPWVLQPEPSVLIGNVIHAAMDVSPRMLVDPLAGYRYVSTLTSKLVKLQGGLLLRALLTSDDDTRSTSTGTPDVRSVA